MYSINHIIYKERVNKEEDVNIDITESDIRISRVNEREVKD